jgi:ubiquinone/menaquinone biosynthesis C-methylase UbiE
VEKALHILPDLAAGACFLDEAGVLVSEENLTMPDTDMTHADVLRERPNEEKKNEVRAFWNSDPCGTRYLEGNDDFEAHARARYALEPFIFEFADFKNSRGLKVLEIGVGMGADYLEWLKAGAQATGVDFSSASIERTRQRCELAGHECDLRVADAEHLSFPDNSFDVVYSYGVMHHSPDTQQCVREALRVLKTGGQARIMVYHHPSLTGLMLWLRYGWLRGKSLRQSVYDHLESPGTKTYSRSEAAALMGGFRDVKMRLVFSPGDLLLHQPSARFQSWFYRMVWKLYPRWLLRRFGQKWGLFLLITATK